MINEHSKVVQVDRTKKMILFDQQSVRNDLLFLEKLYEIKFSFALDFPPPHTSTGRRRRRRKRPKRQENDENRRQNVAVIRDDGLRQNTEKFEAVKRRFIAVSGRVRHRFRPSESSSWVTSSLAKMNTTTPRTTHPLSTADENLYTTPTQAPATWAPPPP